MCAWLGVSRSGYYAWRGAEPSKRSGDDSVLIAIMKKVYKEARGNPGVRRMRAGLAALGHLASHKRVHRLMQAAGLRGRHPKAWKRTTIGGDRPVPAPDLIGRDFTAALSDTKWCGDVTYIKTWDGWAYLATVIDLYSRKVIGWAVAAHMRASLITDALGMAIAARKPPPGVIFHSDRGCQGGFNRSSQHLQVEVGEWGDHAGGQLRGRGGRRCVRRVGLRWPGGRTGSGSGWRSPGECRVRTLALRLVCPRRSVRDGSATAAGSGRSAWPRCRGGTCRWRSGRRSRSCGSGGAVSARSPGVRAGRRQRSRGSCAGTPRPGAAGWSTGP